LKAGTQSGSRHRVKGKGIASAKTTGDLIVSVDVVVPTELTDEQKDAVVAFAKAFDGSPRDNVLAQAKQAKRAAS
jgi:molecular chaperone DnaJ